MKIKCTTYRLGLLCGLILFAFLTMPAFAEEISLSASVDKTDIAFEDSLNLTVVLKWQGDIRNYSFEVLPLPKTENLKVVGTSSTIASGEEDDTEVTSRTFKYWLKPTLSGTGVIEPLVLKYISWPDSIPGELTTQEFNVLIANPIPKPEKSSNTAIYIIVLIVLILIAAVVISIIFLKKRPEKEPEKSADEAALDVLLSIKDGAQGDRKTFFTKLYKLLCDYIEKKYQLSTAGKTAAAISDEMEKLDISITQKEKLSGWLVQAETEKFAPLAGTPGDIIRLITELENYFRKNNVSNSTEEK
jgi:hypothetical protein